MASNFTVAKRLGTLALAEARKTREKELISEFQGRIEGVAKAAKANENVKVAKALLGKIPDDPPANLLLGQYYCFVIGDWDKGLPMLALGNDDALKAPAVKELAGVASSSEQGMLGDLWWDLAEKEKGTAKKSMQARAGYWYQKALPGLSGLMKDKVAERIEKATIVRSSNVVQASKMVPPEVIAESPRDARV